MRKLIYHLWHDDTGAIIAAEYLFLATILVIGILIGFASIRDSINTEFAELGNGFLALSQGFVLSGQSGCCSLTDGSQSIDTPSLVPDPLCTPPAIPSVIDTVPCN
jgi:Flp pilus assembly pilin Flp